MQWPSTISTDTVQVPDLLPLDGLLLASNTGAQR
jgi:hypothetical protein